MMSETGYVVYTRQSNSPVWETIRTIKAAQVNGRYNVLSSQNEAEYYIKAGQGLKALGEQEQRKEVAFLSKALGEDFTFTDVKQFIREFNSIIIGKKRFEEALEQMNLALDEYENDTSKHSLAPTLSSLYASKLQTELGRAVNDFIHKHKEDILNDNLSAWEDEYEQIILTCADKAFRKLLNGPDTKEGLKDKFGTYNDHLDQLKEHIKLMENSEKENVFNGIILSKIGVDKVKTLIEDNLDTIKEKLLSSARLNGHKWVGAATSLRSRAGQFGGSVNEYLNQLTQSLGGQCEVTDRGATVLMNEIQKIDNAAIYSFNGEVDSEGIFMDLEDALSGSSSLNETAHRWNDFYEKHLKDLDKYMLLTSGKAYGLNDHSKYGFKNGEARKIGDLTEILTLGPNGMSYQGARDFIDVVVNAIPGAILEDSQDSIKKNLRNKIFESMAYLLFDDWISIGDEAGDNIIHAFTLQDIEIPLSVLLIGAGEAMIEATETSDWFRVTITYPKGVKYPTADIEDYIRILGKKPQPGENTYTIIQEAWNDQRNVALEKIKFTTHFLSNFYDLVLSRIKS